MRWRVVHSGWLAWKLPLRRRAQAQARAPGVRWGCSGLAGRKLPLRRRARVRAGAEAGVGLGLGIELGLERGGLGCSSAWSPGSQRSGERLVLGLQSTRTDGVDGSLRRAGRGSWWVPWPRGLRLGLRVGATMGASSGTSSDPSSASASDARRSFVGRRGGLLLRRCRALLDQLVGVWRRQVRGVDGLAGDLHIEVGKRPRLIEASHP